MRHLIRIIIELIAILWSMAMMVVGLIAVPAGAMFLGYLAVPYLRLDPLPPDITWPWIGGGIIVLAVLYWSSVVMMKLALALTPDTKPKRRPAQAKPEPNIPQPRPSTRKPPGPPDHPGTPSERVG